jgi:hypothetical protein
VIRRVFLSDTFTMGRIPHLKWMIVLSLLISSAPAAWADGIGSQFGLVYGLSVPDAQNTKTYRMWGIKGESFIGPALSLGGYYYASDQGGEIAAVGKFRYTLTGAEMAYHIPNQGGDTFVGFRIGVTKLESTQAGTDLVFSPYHYGFALGYDYPLTSHFVVGFEGSYLHALPGRTEYGGVIYNEDSFSIISFLISMQFRL